MINYLYSITDKELKNLFIPIMYEYYKKLYKFFKEKNETYFLEELKKIKTIFIYKIIIRF